MNNPILSMMEEGRIIRHRWTGRDQHGRQTACLLSALSPDVARKETAAVCPSSVMPKWFAYVTPWMNDNGTEKKWPAMVRRYGALAGRWHVLDKAAWRRLEYATRRIAVETVMSYVDLPPTSMAIVMDAIDMLRRAEAGETIPDYYWSMKWKTTEMACLDYTKPREIRMVMGVVWRAVQFGGILEAYPTTAGSSANTSNTSV